MECLKPKILIPYVKKMNDIDDGLIGYKPIGSLNNDSVIPENAIIVPCRQCISCQINHARDWVSRLIVESQRHDKVWFVTLTYSDENIPAGGLLCKKHVQDFIKRIRKFEQIRYFIAGEYGETTYRPHYHAILFGCSEKIIREKWQFGFVDIKEADSRNMSYVARYTLKKISKEIQKKHLTKLEKEFIIMSKKPIIGGNLSESENHVFVKNGDSVRIYPIPFAIKKNKEKEGKRFYDRRLVKPQNVHVLRLTDLTYSDYQNMRRSAILNKTNLIRRNKV